MSRGARLALIALALTALAAGGPAAAKTRIVAVTADLAALARAVGGDLVVVEAIVPPAVDPEAFEPRASDLERLRGAALLVRVGLGYDFWLDRLLVQAGDLRLMLGGERYVDASLGIPLLEVQARGIVEERGHAHGHANPHYWLDPENARIVTANIAEALVRLLPGESTRIVANRDRFLVALDARLILWRQRLAPFAGVKLIAYHNSWPYFARRFRLDIVDFVEPKPGVAPSPFHLTRLIDRGRKAGVRAVLHEPFEPDEASRLVAGRLGVPIVLLATSVGGVPEAADYLELMDFNVAALARALSAPTR
jgi:ABC-type Zn uptake system ZnuABC Zn-binding protein ZnuA